MGPGAEAEHHRGTGLSGLGMEADQRRDKDGWDIFAVLKVGVFDQPGGRVLSVLREGGCRGEAMRARC